MKAVLLCRYFLPLWESQSVRRIDRNIVFLGLGKNQGSWRPEPILRNNGVELLKPHKTGTVAAKLEWMEQEFVKCRYTDLFKVEKRIYRRGNHTADNNVQRASEIELIGALCRLIRHIRDGIPNNFRGKSHMYDVGRYVTRLLLIFLVHLPLVLSCKNCPLFRNTNMNHSCLLLQLPWGTVPHR
jgi:hypothetical protein